MHVFVSWSGSRSKALADVLRELLPNVLQNIKVWMSEHDVEAGARWSTTLSERLALSNVGIACVTSENQHAPWLLFEAGALSRSLQDGRLIPLLLDVTPAQVTYPLAQFQILQTDRSGIERLVQTLNSLTLEPVETQRLQKQIDKWWPEFQAGIARAALVSSTAPATPERSTKELLEEVLQEVRDLAKVRSTPPVAPERVWIDLRPLVGPEGPVLAIEELHNLTVSDFLDEIWRQICRFDDVPPYTYGSNWVLRTQAGVELSDLGKTYIQSHGKKRDNRPIGKFGLRSGDVLEADRPTRGEA